jgi:hypothetical protein
MSDFNRARTRKSTFGPPPVRSTCKHCRHAILSEDAAVWRTFTPIGLVHAYCEREYQQGTAGGEPAGAVA